MPPFREVVYTVILSYPDEEFEAHVKAAGPDEALRLAIERATGNTRFGAFTISAVNPFERT